MIDKKNYICLNDEKDILGITRIDRIFESGWVLELFDYIKTVLNEEPYITKKGKGGYTYVHWLVASYFILFQSPKAFHNLLELEINKANGVERYETLKYYHPIIQKEIYSKKFIYIVYNEENLNFKVGISDNVEERIKQLQTGNPNKILLHGKISCYNAFDIEQTIIVRYKKFLKTGEWFDGNKISMDEVLNDIKSLNFLFKNAHHNSINVYKRFDLK